MNASPLYDTTVKLNMTHNISTAVMTEIRLDLTMTIWQVKLQAEKRYGSDPSQVQLTLKDKQGNVLHMLNNDGASLGVYDPHDGYIIHVVDKNPNSILKGLEDVSQVQKYTISEEDYNKLPFNMRKFKQQFIQNNAAGNLANNEDQNDKPFFDDDFEKDQANLINPGQRCQLIENHNRGTVRFVGQVAQMGLGYFVGVQLDEPFGTNNGTIKGYSYFTCPPNYGIFLRPSEIQVGEFPELDLEDEI